MKLPVKTAPRYIIMGQTFPAYSQLISHSSPMYTRYMVSAVLSKSYKNMHYCFTNFIWVKSRRCGCLVTWFCYHFIAKPGNKTATPSWPDPSMHLSMLIYLTCLEYKTENNHIKLYCYYFVLLSGLEVITLREVYCFCEARRASHCHSPQSTYSSKSTCCTVSAQKTAMYVVVYAGRLIAQNSIVEIINW